MSRLIGYGEAVADGHMAPGAVLDVGKAVRLAAGVVMEGALVLDDEVAATQLVEAARVYELEELRGALVASGLATAEGLDALGGGGVRAQVENP